MMGRREGDQQGAVIHAGGGVTEGDRAAEADQRGTGSERCAAGDTQEEEDGECAAREGEAGNRPGGAEEFSQTHAGAADEDGGGAGEEQELNSSKSESKPAGDADEGRPRVESTRRAEEKKEDAAPGDGFERERERTQEDGEQIEVAEEPDQDWTSGR